MKSMKYLVALVGAVALFASAQASATLINFENGPSKGLVDNDAVTNQYMSEGVTFTGAFLEATGDSSLPPPDTNPQAFFNDVTGKWDDPAAPGLGNWFLRSAGEVSSRGGMGVYLTVVYATPVTAASGQIWDIDGSASDTEQWSVNAYAGGILVASVMSPLGNTKDDTSLNGKPWTFDLPSTTPFDRIEFEFIGSKTRGVGLAFDNFNTSALSVPEPAALGMFGLGALLIGLFAGLRRRMD